MSICKGGGAASSLPFRLGLIQGESSIKWAGRVMKSKPPSVPDKENGFVLLAVLVFFRKHACSDWAFVSAESLKTRFRGGKNPQISHIQKAGFCIRFIKGPSSWRLDNKLQVGLCRH